MMDKLFVVGDIHGKLDMLNELLKSWNPDSEKLVFIGDYLDRGPNSLGVLRRVKELKEKYGANPIGGNHELMFLMFLDESEDVGFIKWVEDESTINYYEDVRTSVSVWYYSNGGDKTVDSFYTDYSAYKYLPSRHSEYIKSNFAEEIDFIRNLPDYFEWNDYICVHAGVNLALLDWKKSGVDNFRWIRKPFFSLQNDTNKNFIFGHTPTRHLNKDGHDGVWVSPCRSKIGIDGGAVFGGLMHGVVVDGNQIICNSVDKNLLTSKRIIKL